MRKITGGDVTRTASTFSSRGPLDDGEIARAWRARAATDPSSAGSSPVPGSLAWRDGTRAPFEFTCTLAGPKGATQTRGTYDEATGAIQFDVVGTVKQESRAPLSPVVAGVAARAATSSVDARLLDSIRAAVRSRYAEEGEVCQVWFEPQSVRLKQDPGAPPTFVASATDLREPQGSGARHVRLQGGYDPKTFEVWLAKSAATPRLVEGPRDGKKVVDFSEVAARRAAAGRPSTPPR